MEIVEVAQKELKAEAEAQADRGVLVCCLKLELARHKDTEVQVPVSPDDLIETLDEHNIQLQAWRPWASSSTSSAEINQWQKTLGNHRERAQADTAHGAEGVGGPRGDLPRFAGHPRSTPPTTRSASRVSTASSRKR